jgi:formylglycine-generating enzyme required for sulfatase activity
MIKVSPPNCRMLLAVVSTSILASTALGGEISRIPEGNYAPFYIKEGSSSSEDKLIRVKAFLIDVNQVTNEEYYQFVLANQEWRKGDVSKLFADSHYLQHWGKIGAEFSEQDAKKPVVNVSWFAAQGYCESLGKRLPSTDEWEYVLNDMDKNKESIHRAVMDWYAVPNRELPSLIDRPKNGFGVSDMVAVVWEWTNDFNNFMVRNDSRDSGSKAAFCGGGSLNVTELDNYAAFMRYSYRSSLQGNFTGKNLGFRCAKDKE